MCQQFQAQKMFAIILYQLAIMSVKQETSSSSTCPDAAECSGTSSRVKNKKHELQGGFDCMCLCRGTPPNTSRLTAVLCVSSRTPILWVAVVSASVSPASSPYKMIVNPVQCAMRTSPLVSLTNDFSIR